MHERSILLPPEPYEDLDAYRAAGGGEGLRRAHEIGPEATITEVRESGLRGRGGAGFPTAIKWAGLRGEDADRKYLVGNAAEGEPGTFKDRWLIRYNPYQLLEGLAIGAWAIGVDEVYIGTKARYQKEVRRLVDAAAEMTDAGFLSDIKYTLVEGPDDYLLGEEKGLLESIEGNQPLPRLYPPYIRGLYADQAFSNPAVVDNVETLCNIPHILREGSAWYRSLGTDKSPGTMVFSISGDVQREAIVELEMGTPFSYLVNDVAGGFAPGRSFQAAFSGVSNRPIRPEHIDVPMDFESLKAAGAGIGSAGFMAYDDTACMAEIGAVLSKFLYEGSCGQCPSCKLGTEMLAEMFADLAAGKARPGMLESMDAWLVKITENNRCGLPAGQQSLADGILSYFRDDLYARLDGSPCSNPGHVRLPKFVDYLPNEGRFVYWDEVYG